MLYVQAGENKHICGRAGDLGSDVVTSERPVPDLAVPARYLPGTWSVLARYLIGT